jgi:hypothetical protein
MQLGIAKSPSSFTDRNPSASAPAPLIFISRASAERNVFPSPRATGQRSSAMSKSMSSFLRPLPTLTILAGISLAASAHAADLVLRYDFENIPSNTAPIPDVTGNGNNGTFVDLGEGGGPITDAQVGAGAYQLPQVDIPTTFNLPTDQFSMAFWMKFPQGQLPSNIQALVSNSNGGFNANGFRLYINDFNTTSGRPTVETGDGSNGAGIAFNPAYPTDANGNAQSDGKYHLMVWNMDLTNNHAEILFDDNSMANGPMAPGFNLAGPIHLGAFNGGVFASKVQMDDFRVYHGLLTDADIQALLNPVTHFRGDTNQDGVVDLTDYNNVINFFGTTEPAFTNGDSTGDGAVDLNDYNDVINFFGAKVPQAGLEGGLVTPLASVAVPEPTSLALLAVGSLFTLKRRR